MGSDCVQCSSECQPPLCHHRSAEIPLTVCLVPWAVKPPACTVRPGRKPPHPTDYNFHRRRLYQQVVPDCPPCWVQCLGQGHPPRCVCVHGDKQIHRAARTLYICLPGTAHSPPPAKALWPNPTAASPPPEGVTPLKFSIRWIAFCCTAPDHRRNQKTCNMSRQGADRGSSQIHREM